MESPEIGAEFIEDRVEHVPLACLVDELDIIFERNEEGPGPRAIIEEEIPGALGTIACVRCERCNAGAMVTHTEWKIESIEPPKSGSDLDSCPRLTGLAR